MTARALKSTLAGIPDPPRRAVVKFAAGAAGIAILLFAYYAYTWRSIAGFITAMDVCPYPLWDFHEYYYPTGEAVFRTGLPVEGFLYSPFMAILLAAFPPLGLHASLVLWWVLQAVFVILYLALFCRLVPAGLPIRLLFAVLVLSSYPLLLNLLAGQVSVFMTVALLGMLAFKGRGHRAVAGCLYAFAVSLKFYPAIFLAPLAARRDLRAVLLAVVSATAFLFVIPAVLIGAGDTRAFYSALLDAFRDSDWVVANPHSYYFPHVALRLADASGHDVRAHLPVLRWIALGIAAVNLGLILLVEGARLRHADLWSFQVVFLTIPFVLKTSWPHDFVFLSFTQALLAWWLLEGKEAAPGFDTQVRSSRSSAWPARLLHGRAALAFPLLLTSIGLSNIVCFNLLGDPDRYGFCGFLFWANLLLLVALYVELMPSALRRLREPKAA